MQNSAEQLLRINQPVETPLCPLSPQMGYLTRRFWGFWSPICDPKSAQCRLFQQTEPFYVLGGIEAGRKGGPRGIRRATRERRRSRSGDGPAPPRYHNERR